MQAFLINLNDRHQVSQFLKLPFRLYANVAQWVPPLEMEARQMLNQRKNPFFLHSEAGFFLAIDSDGNEPSVVGRLAILNNRRFNAFHQEKTAFFYLFECEENLKAAACLFEAARVWASERELNKITGPKGFSVFDGLGLLVKGFEYRPAFGLPYNLPYYPSLIEGAGFRPCGEMLSGYLGPGFQFPENLHQVSNLVQKRRGLYIARYKTKRDLRALVPKLKNLYNDSLVGTIGNTPLTDEEVRSLANQMLWFADPRLIKIVMKGDEPVGFLFAYPDISAAIQRTQGKIFPFGWARLLLELRRTKWVNVNGAGMKAGYRGLGGTALLFSEIYKSILEGKFEYADIVQIGAENETMLRELRDMGIYFYKIHRLYEREV